MLLTDNQIGRQTKQCYQKHYLFAKEVTTIITYVHIFKAITKYLASQICSATTEFTQLGMTRN